MSQRVKWVFTLHNPPQEWKERLKELEKEQAVTYLLAAFELGSEESPHLQGYLTVKPRKRMNQVKKLFQEVFGEELGKTVHLEGAKGNLAQQKKYILKEGLESVELGEHAGQGTRTDLQGLLEVALSGASFLEMAEAYPTTHARYHKWAGKVRKEALKRNHLKKLKTELAAAVLRPWQATVLEKLKTQNGRKVLWVWDQIGDKGKTWMGRYLAATLDAFLCTGGKQADIAYAFNMEEYVVLDLARQLEDHKHLYKLLENLKDGHMFSPKYMSRTNFWSGSKVVIFANFPPEREQMSRDRWEVIELIEPMLEQEREE